MLSATSASQIRSLWERCAGLPGGRWLFGVLLGRMVPYSGTISPRVLELRDGFAKVAMRDRRRVRNHLGSIHAIALTNLAEVTSGLALHYGLPGHARAILTELSIEYLKKARGTIVAEAVAPIPTGLEREEIVLETSIRDEEGVVVAIARVKWLVGPRESDTTP